MANLTEGNRLQNGRTEMLYNGYLVAIRQTNGVLAVPCKRCGGTGHYSYNPMDGTICYGCNGRGIGDTITEAEAIRKAENRIKARARAAAKAEAKAAEARAKVEAWKAENADLVEALKPYETQMDEDGYAKRPVNTFLASLADQMSYRPLSDRQIESAWSALKVQADRDAERAQEAARQAEAGHLGSIGEKITAEVEILNVIFFEGDWNRSHSYLVVMRSTQGHMLKTFSSGAFGREAEKGQTLTIKGTVKAHEDYNGAPQTSLKMVKAVSN